MLKNQALEYIQRGKNIIWSLFNKKSYTKIPEPNAWNTSGKPENRIVVDLGLEMGSVTGLRTIEIKQGSALAWSIDGKLALNNMEEIKSKLQKGVTLLQSYGYKYNGHWYNSLRGY